MGGSKSFTSAAIGFLSSDDTAMIPTKTFNFHTFVINIYFPKKMMFDSSCFRF